MTNRIVVTLRNGEVYWHVSRTDAENWDLEMTLGPTGSMQIWAREKGKGEERVTVAVYALDQVLTATITDGTEPKAADPVRGPGGRGRHEFLEEIESCKRSWSDPNKLTFEIHFRPGLERGLREAVSETLLKSITTGRWR